LHAGQINSNCAPHSSQNEASAGLSLLHFAHSIDVYSASIEQGLGVLQISGVEAFGEPIVDVGQHCERLLATASIAKQTSHRKLIDSAIDQHHGRFVNEAGDSVLAEFASVVEAVNCAVEIQTGLKAENSSLAPGRRMEFRIGVNLGDVMVEGQEIYGDGVNVAARVESLAEPGGISISDTAYAQVRDKLALVYEDAGEQTVKNIARPVRVWRVLLNGAVASPRRTPQIVRKYRRAGALSLVGLAIIIATFILVQQFVAEAPDGSHVDPDAREASPAIAGYSVDRCTAVREPERRSAARVFQRRPQRPIDQFPLAASRPLCDRAQLEGADSVKVNAVGDLVVMVAGERLSLRKPTAFQDLRGKREQIAARYILQNDAASEFGTIEVAFKLSGYDRREPLMIDPALSYSSYLGGTNPGSINNGATAIAVDQQGNAYITGSTSATDFPATAGAPVGRADISGAWPTSAAVLTHHATVGKEQHGVDVERRLVLEFHPFASHFSDPLFGRYSWQQHLRCHRKP
jgi:hypothetical protein